MKINLVNKKFGKLLVVEFAGQYGKGYNTKTQFITFMGTKNNEK